MVESKTNLTIKINVYNMKNIVKIIILSIFAFGVLASCSKDTEGISKVTTFATLTLNGQPIMGVALGSSFVDPGAVAKEGTEDLTADIVISGSVNTNVEGSYIITYSVKNTEGYDATITRRVIVFDASTLPSISLDDVSGSYKSSILREYAGASASRGPYNINIYKIADGLFYIDDFLGGWYRDGSGYGDAYTGSGMFILHSNNTISVYSSYIPGWGTAIELFDVSTYLNGVIILKVIMDDTPTMLFTVTLTK
jgi:hypothetical protein